MKYIHLIVVLKNPLHVLEIILMKNYIHRIHASTQAL